MKKRNLLVIFSLTLSLGLLAAGCGATDPGLVTPPTITGTPLVSGTGTYASGYCAGRILSGGSAGDLCQTRRDLTLAMAAAYPSLRPSDGVDGYYARQIVDKLTGLPIQIKAGDKLYWTASTSASGLGNVDYTSNCVLGILCFSYGTNKCKVTSMDNLNGGLYATDGTEIFLMGSSLNARPMTHDGNLKIGFNDGNLNSGQAICWNLTFTQFWINHCENKSGATVACP